jgi:hypothetical protein
MKSQQLSLKESNLIARAGRAFSKRDESRLNQPSAASQIEEHDGHLWAVLRNCRGTLAVYRVRKGGKRQYAATYPASIL